MAATPRDPNQSHTRLEMLIVADVDNDRNAEVGNTENASGSSAAQGICVLGDMTDSWVPTRRVWNQHSSYVTNVLANTTAAQSYVPIE